MKSKILDAVHQTATGLRKSGAITEDTESFLTAVAGTLGDDFSDDITDDDLRAVCKPGQRGQRRIILEDEKNRLQVPEPNSLAVRACCHSALFA